MATATPATATRARIDGGDWQPADLEMAVDTEQVWFMSASMPDRNWRWVDPAGHVHFWTTDWNEAGVGRGLLPTCESYRVVTGYDDDGEPYHATRYRCQICSAEVEPGWVTDHQAQGGLTVIKGRHWSLLLHGWTGREPEPGKRFTAEVAMDGRTALGVVAYRQVTMEASGHDRPRIRMQFAGAGPLGQKWERPR